MRAAAAAPRVFPAIVRGRIGQRRKREPRRVRGSRPNPRTSDVAQERQRPRAPPARDSVAGPTAPTLSSETHPEIRSGSVTGSRQRHTCPADPACARGHEKRDDRPDSPRGGQLPERQRPPDELAYPSDLPSPACPRIRLKRIDPGATLLTRILSLASCCAIALARLISAALTALQVIRPPDSRPKIDAIITIRPRGARICGTAMRDAARREERLIEGLLPLVAGVDDVGTLARPTLLTRMSSPPKVSTVRMMTSATLSVARSA